MEEHSGLQVPLVGDGSGLERSDRFHAEELELAFRNKAIPLEGLAYDVTPTGMHYTLTHYDIPAVDVASWRLAFDGDVHRRFAITLPELQKRGSRTMQVTLECAGDGRALLTPRPLSQPWRYGAVGTAEWTGTPLRPLLEDAGLRDNVREILFTGLDRGIEGGVEQSFQRSLQLDEALRDDALLAWAMNGQPLEPQHGFPVRLVIPGWYGMAHVKWLRSITALAEPFGGYQQSVAYRYSETRGDLGKAVELMLVRSLMVPPGVPDFLTRSRVVDRGLVEVQGRAWSGRASISGVEFSADGGRSWDACDVEAPMAAHPSAWQLWRVRWNAREVGSFDLVCRATDSNGLTQPVDQAWTARGMGNNMAQRVRVIVR